MLSLASFALFFASFNNRAKIVRSVKPKRSAMWPFTENVCKALWWKEPPGFREDCWKGRDDGTLTLLCHSTSQAGKTSKSSRNEVTRPLCFPQIHTPTEAESFQEWEGPPPACTARGLGTAMGDGKLGVSFLSSGYHRILLDSKVTSREVNIQWRLWWNFHLAWRELHLETDLNWV